jgi:hypothetical protein
MRDTQENEFQISPQNFHLETVETLEQDAEKVFENPEWHKIPELAFQHRRELLEGWEQEFAQITPATHCLTIMHSPAYKFLQEDNESLSEYAEKCAQARKLLQKLFKKFDPKDKNETIRIFVDNLLRNLATSLPDQEQLSGYHPDFHTNRMLGDADKARCQLLKWEREVVKEADEMLHLVKKS